MTSHALLHASTFAAAAHSTQVRKNVARTPYINHPLQVAFLISSSLPSESVPIEVLQAAILHDTVEDTAVTLDEIEKTFGARVRRIVDEVSDDKGKNKQERKQAQIDHAPHVSVDAKLADKLANLTDLTTDVPVGWTTERVQEYFVWAKRVTDGCKDANPTLAKQLEELYLSATFVHDGKTHKCHPGYGGGPPPPPSA
ncbi:hypothetical protein RQP46_005904 [Phenoliferia psychrophenolica]